MARRSRRSRWRTGCGAAFSVEILGEERLVVAHEVKRTYLRKLDVDEVVGAVRSAISQQHDLVVEGDAIALALHPELEAAGGSQAGDRGRIDRRGKAFTDPQHLPAGYRHHCRGLEFLFTAFGKTFQ